MKKYLTTVSIFLLCGVFAYLQGRENSPEADSSDSEPLQQRSSASEKLEKPGKKKKKKQQVPYPKIRYTIVSKQADMVLSIHHGLKRDGETLLIWPNSMTDSQRWEIRPVKKPYIQLVAKHSGMPIGIKDSSKEEGAKVVQLAETGDREQCWKLKMDPDGYARFQNQLTRKFLTIENRGQGAHLVQKGKLDSDDQKFRLVVVEFE